MIRTQAHNKKPQTYLHELGSNITYGMVCNLLLGKMKQHFTGFVWQMVIMSYITN